MNPPFPSCRHLDIRKFDDLRCCLECGLAIFETSSLPQQIPHRQILPDQLLDNVSKTRAELDTCYKYQRLNFALGQEIRLVVLHPGEFGDPVFCDIVHANLLDDPFFEAVSYTWATEDGDDSSSGKIHCSGHNIPVTANCEGALRWFRKRGLRRTLWMDSICIDQSSILERNHQVGLMDEIYSRASAVLIYIQQPAWDCFDIFDWLRKPVTSLEEDAIISSDVRRFFRLRYFSRAWVIQEVALARYAFMVVGPYVTELSINIVDRLKDLCGRYAIKVPGPLQWTPGHFNHLDILNCLNTVRESSCKDPRDKVFAVLSLMDPFIRSLIVVDYSKSQAETYTNATIISITEQQHLGVLTHVSSSANDDHGLPSWVPDWNAPAPATFDALPPQFKRRPSNNKSTKTNYSRPHILYGDIVLNMVQYSYLQSESLPTYYTVKKNADSSVEIGVPVKSSGGGWRASVARSPADHFFDPLNIAETSTGSYQADKICVYYGAYSLNGACSHNRSFPPPRSHPAFSSSPLTIPWKPFIGAKVLTTIESFFFLDSTYGRQSPVEESRSSATFFQPPRTNIHSLPFLRVRATHLDTIVVPTSMLPDAFEFAWNLSQKANNIMDPGYCWILPFFLQTQKRLTFSWEDAKFGFSAPPDMPPSKIGHTIFWDNSPFDSPNVPLPSHHIPYYNLKDLNSFLSDAQRFGKGKTMFQTRYSVGFAPKKVMKWDMVFAVDGSRTPVILRKTGSGIGQYRFIGLCYLWAAGDKDHWSEGPNSCWRVESEEYGRRDQSQWTEMINIY